MPFYELQAVFLNLFQDLILASFLESLRRSFLLGLSENGFLRLF